MIEEPTVVYVDTSGSMFPHLEVTRRLIQDLIIRCAKNNPGIVKWFSVNSEGVRKTSPSPLMQHDGLFAGGGGEEELLEHIVNGSFAPDVPYLGRWNLDDWHLIYITDGESRLIPDLVRENVEIVSVQSGNVLAANYSRAVFESMKTIAQQSNGKLPKDRVLLLHCGYIYSSDQRYPAALVARRLEVELEDWDERLNQALTSGEDQYKVNSKCMDIYKGVQRLLDDNTQVFKTFDYLRQSAIAIMTAACVKAFNFTPEQARKLVNDPAINPNASSPQEDTPMASIKTTVSLDLSRTHRATLADLKTLIAEVEHVGGTDESYVDLSHALSTYRFDAIVVTASVQDSRLTDALAITDDGARTSALIALLDTELRDEAKKHLVAAKVKKA